ncbi:MAG: hypothetical protein HYZ28_07070 [Myxococcales bacterium]|nr:hypothetical protein [Myxococcales bacterium]
MLGLLVASALAAGEAKIAVMTLEAGEGVPEKTASAITEAVIAELRRLPNVRAVTPAEIATLLSFERQRQLLSCKEDASCMVELGAALGVSRLLMGSVAKLGRSWLVHLKLIDAEKGAAVAQSDRRLKDKSIDDVLDSLPAMVAELFGKSLIPPEPPSAVGTAPPTQGPAPATSVSPREPGGVDEPYPGDVRPKLALVHDGKGHYLAFTPYAGLETPLFAGDGESFWEQRIGGGGAQGDTQFDLVFWDPRFPAGYQRSFDFKEGKYTLQCGEAVYPYPPVPQKAAVPLLKKAKLFKPRWRRSVQALARDDAGTYYLVDGPREEKDESRKLRLFVGPRGRLRELPLDDSIQDAKGLLLLSAEGRLRVPPRGEHAEWITPGGKLELSNFELGPREAKLVYGELGLYKGEPLRTACDPYLP